MFHLRINQVVGFTSKMFEKHPRKTDILSKDAGRRPASSRKMSNILLVKTNYLVSA